MSSTRLSRNRHSSDSGSSGTSGTRGTRHGKHAPGNGSFAKRWCFTINNYVDEDIQRMHASCTEANLVFGIAGKETSSTGTPHLQGFLHFTKRQRISSIKKLLGDRVHLEVARGDDNANEKYCSKEGDVVFQLGRPADGVPALRSEDRFRERVVETLAARQRGEKIHDAIDDAGILACYRTSTSLVEKIESSQKISRTIANITEEYKTVIWKCWQHDALSKMHSTPDKRKVHWYWDADGCAGKTFLSRYAISHLDCVRFENAKSNDIKHGFNGEKIVIFDLSRSQMDRVNYEVIESIKNGIIFSGKYQSASKIFDIPHVFIFANWPPDESKLSADRWEITEITEQNSAWYVKQALLRALYRKPR